MDNIRDDLKWIFRAVTVVGVILLMIYLPIMGYIIGFVIFVILFGVVYVIYAIYDNTGDRYLKKKFGKDFKKAISNGQLSLHEAYPCVPDGHYTSKKRIEDVCGIELPNYTIKECRETLPDFTGDYWGEADIEFETPIEDNIILQIEEYMEHSQSKWERRRDGSDYICHLLEPNLDVRPSQDVFWRLIIRKGSSKGEIVYGRI